MKETSNVYPVNAPVEQVYGKLSNLENLRPLIEKAKEAPLPPIGGATSEQMEQVRETLKNVEVTEDTISVPAPMIGTIELRIIDREPLKCVKIETEQSPIKATLWIQTLPVTDITSKMRVTLDADIPFMLKAMVGSKLKQGVEKVAEMLAFALAK